MPAEIRVIAVPLDGDVNPGDSLVDLLLRELKQQKFTLEQGDVLVVKHKIVSKAEGQLVRLDAVRPTSASQLWAQRYK